MMSFLRSANAKQARSASDSPADLVSATDASKLNGFFITPTA